MPLRELTVIVPVYNTMPELKACMDSLLEQDIGADRYEIVAVNDGSTDGSGELLDEYAAKYPHLRVLHQENSGWPGQPRNRALDASESRYVFFADADDQLGRQSLRRQVEFADEYSCDIVVPTLTDQPVGKLWSETAVDADRVLLFKTLSPQKLFRRAFLDEHALRFPEGVVPLEDGLVLARAYLLAKRVSVLTGYDYYHKRPRGEGDNISMRGKEPQPFIDSVTKIIDIVREQAWDQDMADRIVLDIYRRKAVKYLLADRVRRYTDSKRQAWLDAVGELTRTRISPELESRLPAQAQLRSQAARLGRMDALTALADAINAGTLSASLDSGQLHTGLPGLPNTDVVDTVQNLQVRGTLALARTARDGFHLEIDVSTAPFTLAGAEWELVVRARDGARSADIVIPLRKPSPAMTSSTTRVRGYIPAERLSSTTEQRWDTSLRVSRATAGGPAKEVRLAPQQALGSDFWNHSVTTPQGRVEPYLTVHGNVSFRTGPNERVEHDPAKLTGTAVRARQWARWHTRKIGRQAAVTSSLPSRTLTALPQRPTERVRAAVRDIQENPRARAAARKLLARLGVSAGNTGNGALVVSRKQRLHVSTVDADTALITTRDTKRQPGVYETHKALFEHMVTEHVVDTVHTYGVNCVLDVGANKGQYARKLRKAGYKGHIISFEPVPDTFAQLQRHAAKDPKWHVQHCALGEADTTMSMHVVAGTMSSLLPASQYGGRRYKRFGNEDRVDVPVRTLENLLEDILPSGLGSPRLYLKLDTQGYDLEAFAGLGQTARHIVAMQSEVALLQIYEGMPRLPEAIATYEAAGFEITGMFPVTREKDTGRVLEFDCVLARADMLGTSRSAR